MTLLIWGALAAAGATVLRQLWLGIGPPWHWPALIFRRERRGLTVAARPIAKRWDTVTGHQPAPDPFQILAMQHRLSALAHELQSLESDDADRRYWARAHRIHTRKCAYDQLLTQACKLAGVPAARTSPEARMETSEDGVVLRAQVGHRSQEEWFRDEMELASRGWSW